MKPSNVEVHRGLVNIVFDETEICEVTANSVSYRGIGLDKLVETSSFSEIISLLIFGELNSDLAQIDSQLLEGYRVGFQAGKVVAKGGYRKNPSQAMFAGLAVAGQQLALLDECIDDVRLQGVARIGATGGVLVALLSTSSSLDRSLDGNGQSQASFIDFIFHAITAAPRHSGGGHAEFQKLLIILAEHSACASTFAARVAASTKCSLDAALLAAFAAFDGPRHGKAIVDVCYMIEQLSRKEADEQVMDAVDLGEFPPGFGHRIYRKTDPRISLIKDAMATLVLDPVAKEYDATVKEVVQRYAHMQRLGLSPNVDLYAGLMMMILGVPISYTTPLFGVARSVGWIAHILEQRVANILIRPQLKYITPIGA